MEDQENKPEVIPEVTPEVKQERPEINYQAELARKNAELERLRMQNEELSKPKRDPQDIRTWTDSELKMLAKSNDASVVAYKEQAEELLFERKIAAVRAKEREQERREAVNSQLTEKYPETSDPNSEFSLKMNKVMQEYDLAKTPAGRLAAARIVAAEGKASGKSAEQIEKDRVASLKANMADGDKPKPVEVKKPGDQKALREKLLAEKDTSYEAMGELLDSRGIREKFGKVWGS